MEYVIMRLVSHSIGLRVFEGELRLKVFEERVWGPKSEKVNENEKIASQCMLFIK